MNHIFIKILSPQSNADIRLTEQDLYVLKSDAVKHNLLLLVYTQLEKFFKEHKNNSFIGEFLEELKPLYFKSISRSAIQEGVEREIVSLLDKYNIKAIVIKGNEIAKEIYNNPNCRTSTDVDILIRRSDALKMHEILSGAGYRNMINFPLKYSLHRLHQATYFHPVTRVPIEMHWNFGIPYLFHLNSEEIWEETIANDAGTLQLSPGMVMIMLLIHHHFHSFRELKILVDLLWGFYKYDREVDWHLFIRKIRKIGLIKTTQITLNQIQRLWSETAHKMQFFQILSSELSGTGLKVPDFVMSYFTMDLETNNIPNIYKDKLVARFCLDRWTDTVLSFPRTLFPVPEAIKEYYSDRRNWTLPYNYFRFIKWRVKDWTQLSR